MEYGLFFSKNTQDSLEVCWIDVKLPRLASHIDKRPSGDFRGGAFKRDG